jgi:hypothetical protein
VLEKNSAAPQIQERQRRISGSPIAERKIPCMKKYDLEKLWDEHTKYEFATPDVEATLATMVDDAYVNHVPVMTGGKGKSALRTFYGKDFILACRRTLP